MLQYEQDVRETKRSESSNQNKLATIVDTVATTVSTTVATTVATTVSTTIDTVATIGKVSTYVVTAPFYAVSYLWPKSKSDSIEKKISKYNINLRIYLEYSVLQELDKEKQLIVCAAAAAAPTPGDDPENMRKILIALLASALLTTSGVAIVVYSGSSGLLPTILVETGVAGINHSIKTIEKNEKFLWKEWLNEIAETASETLVLGAMNKLREKVPFKIKGKVNKDIINALCNIYDLIEPFSNVIICIVKQNDLEEIVFEVIKSIDEKYSTSFSGLTVFETKIFSNKPVDLDGPFGKYKKIERKATNISFKIYHDRSISINI